MAITTVGRSKELKKAKEKSIKLNPMGKTAQKEAAMKKFPERKFKARALVESVQDKNAPMKKARLEDSVRGKKMVFKKAGGRAGYNTGKTVQKTDTSGKPRLPQEEPMRDRMKQPLKTKVKYPGSKVKIPVSERKGRDTFRSSSKEVLKGGKEHKKYLDTIRVNRSSGGPIEVRDIDGDGFKEGWEIGRAKGMAKGMGKKLKMKSGGIVLKGKKVGCQIK